MAALSLSEPACAADQAVSDKYAAWIAAGTMDFDLKELDKQDKRIVHESGWLPGIEAGVNALIGRTELRFQSAYYDGDVDYNGQTQSNLPINSSTDHRIWDAGVTAAYRLPLELSPRFNIYAGIGYRHWDRNIKPVGSILGLDETYRWWSSRVGLEIAWKSGASRWKLDGQLTRTLNPEVKIDSFATFDSTTLDLGERWGWRTGISWSYELSSQFLAGVRGFYESWDLGRSDDANLTQNGVPVGTIYQPQIENRNYGAVIELQRHWQ